VDVPPLAPPIPGSPYASPRDAARHRLQATLAELQSGRDARIAVRGFAEALSIDGTYAAAAWDLAIAAALTEKWSDAIAAMEEAARLDAARFAKPATAQLERLRQVAALSKTPEGQRKLRYDVALHFAAQGIGKAAPADSMAALAEVGRLDPKRWEVPAMLAGLAGEGSGYESAMKFLEITISNAPQGDVRTALERALRAAQRELKYDAARASAEAACDRGEYGKAAELYETAWAAIPARTSNGMEAAADWLADDDTKHAAALLLRLKQSGDTNLAAAAGRMIEEIKGIEPAAGQAAPDASAFFGDPGFAEPPHIQDLLPRVDTASFEVLSRPLPRMVSDSEPVVLLAALDANRAEGAPPIPLPQLPAPRIAGDHPWAELRAPKMPAAVPVKAEPQRQTAEIPGNARSRRLLSVTTEPTGASIFFEAEPVCVSPCDIQAPTGPHELRVALEGFEDCVTSVTIAGPRTNVDLPLVVARGTVIVEAPAAAAITVNGSRQGAPHRSRFR
jgi:tetratricopeptide (TPR) repeat protein